MRTNPQRVAEFNRCDARRRYADMSFGEALSLFEALWAEAAALDPDFPGDWRSDLEGDFAVARAINGLPPSP